MLTRTRLEGDTMQELENSVGRIEAELACRALADRNGGEDPSRTHSVFGFCDGYQ